MQLNQKRKWIIEQVRKHGEFLKKNQEKLDIYEGNLLPYVDRILRDSLSPQYYNAIKSRILPINILQRYIDKVSTAYQKPPMRTSENADETAFIEYYTKTLDLNNSGSIADEYSHLFKGFAWEPYINSEGVPAMRELPFDKFLVLSDSVVNPEEATIFVKIVGCFGDDDENKILLFTYTDEEFDAFYMNEATAAEYLADNGGVNVVGTIPFIYGKRQKSKLIPTQDTDMLAIVKAIPVMLSDAAGAQMFQCFTILYGIDVSFENAVIAPNALWSIKSDKETDKNPSVGSIKPEADTEKVVSFVMQTFILWLETKGIRVGSVGNVDGGNAANGISKIIDEMDVHKVVCDSMDWFTKDEHVLWNKKLPKLHSYWIQSGLISPDELKNVPSIITDPEITVEFERPQPMISRDVEIKNCKDELDIGTMDLETAIRTLHPKYTDEEVQKLVDAKDAKKAEDAAALQVQLNKGNPPGQTVPPAKDGSLPPKGDANAVDANKNSGAKAPKA